MEFLVEADTSNVERFMRELPPRCRAAMADGMDHATRSFFSKFYKERLQGPPGIQHTHGGIFHRFRRAVMVNGKMVFLRQQARQSQSASIIAQSSKDPMNMSVDMYTQSDVAGMHERGGTISSSKAMPVPLNQEARDMLKAKMSLDDLKVMKINGKVFLGRKRRLGGPQILFLLTHQVHIKPRLGFYLTWDAHANRRDEIMRDALNNALGKV